MDLENVFRKYRVSNYRVKNTEREPDMVRAESVISAPYTSFTGATLQKGKALASEIEGYRRRVQTFINFLGLIAPQWWDRLYPYKDELVKRPSRSADLVRTTEARLSARIQRLTPRMVMPAAAAMASIEERDLVAVLPKNLYHTSTSRERFEFKLDNFENTTELVKLALSLARRLGEIERAKQQIILYVADWISSDGRDFHLRARRNAMLAKNVQSCLIERFFGIQALITHYYRRRASMTLEENTITKTPEEASTDPKTQLQNAFNSITAANINVTNQAIMQLLNKADLCVGGDLSMNVDALTDIEGEELIEVATISNQDYSLSSTSTIPHPFITEIMEKPDIPTSNSINYQTDVHALIDMKRWNMSPIKGALPLRTDLNNPFAIRWSSVAEASYFSVGGQEDGLADEPEVELLDVDSRFARRQSRLAKEKQFTQRKGFGNSISKLLTMKQEVDKMIVLRTNINEFPTEKVVQEGQRSNSESRAVLAQNFSEEIMSTEKDSRFIYRGDGECREPIVSRHPVAIRMSSSKHSGGGAGQAKRSRRLVDSSNLLQKTSAYTSVQHRRFESFPLIIGNQDMINTDFRKLLRHQKQSGKH